ncbi:MAG: oligopeptide/dipeptide ABC transporter ATP-binding protein, partial [Acidimicrobiales bacterium]
LGVGPQLYGAGPRFDQAGALPASRPERDRSVQPLLVAENLWVSFPAGKGQRLTAVEDVSLSVSEGETLGIVGESGCGKSTVARCLAGLLCPDVGTVSLRGEVLGARRSSEQHRSVQLVFQDPYSSLNPRLSVRSVLSELLSFHGLAKGDALEIRCRELMALVGLPADALDGYPSSFSGGQRQRIAIARALAVQPQVIVADEPISSLDVSVQAAILALFADLRDRLGIGMVLISHNLAVVRNICDRAAVMYLGRIVEVGEREEIFTDPRHPYTRALLTAAPRLRPGPDRVAARLRGEPPSPTARPTGCAFHPRCPRAEPLCAAERPELLPAPAGSSRLAACHFRDEAL